ncbi:unnamed protein product [Rhizophagus irregularis]|nr:unnamed protein product [Rhizophagus irregularis]
MFKPHFTIWRGTRCTLSIAALPIKCPICKTVNDANSHLGMDEVGEVLRNQIMYNQLYASISNFFLQSHLVTTSITTWGKSLSLDKKKKHLRRAHRRRLNKDLARSRPRVHITSSNHHVTLSRVTKR